MSISHVRRESLDSKVSWTISKSTSDQFVAKYVSPSDVIKLECDKYDTGWYVEFRSDKGDGRGITNSHESFKVLSFIKQAMEVFIDRYSPEIIKFAASSGGGSGNPDRASVYTSMLKRLPGYKINKAELNNIDDYKKKMLLHWCGNQQVTAISWLIGISIL